jgi:serine/threonine protein kinase
MLLSLGSRRTAIEMVQSGSPNGVGNIGSITSYRKLLTSFSGGGYTGDEGMLALCEHFDMTFALFASSGNGGKWYVWTKAENRDKVLEKIEPPTRPRRFGPDHPGRYLLRYKPVKTENLTRWVQEMREAPGELNLEVIGLYHGTGGYKHFFGVGTPAAGQMVAPTPSKTRVEEAIQEACKRMHPLARKNQALLACLEKSPFAACMELPCVQRWLQDTGGDDDGRGDGGGGGQGGDDDDDDDDDDDVSGGGDGDYGNGDGTRSPATSSSAVPPGHRYPTRETGGEKVGGDDADDGDDEDDDGGRRLVKIVTPSGSKSVCEQLQTLDKKIWHSSECRTPQQWSEVISSDRNTLFVACLVGEKGDDDDDDVGGSDAGLRMIGYVVMSNPSCEVAAAGGQQLVTIDRLGVDWEYRYDPKGEKRDNLGVGTALVLKCIAALAGKVRTLRLHAIPATTAFYEKLDFKKLTGEKGPHGTNTVMMERLCGSLIGDIGAADSGDGEDGHDQDDDGTDGKDDDGNGSDGGDDGGGDADGGGGRGSSGSRGGGGGGDDRDGADGEKPDGDARGSTSSSSSSLSPSPPPPPGPQLQPPDQNASDIHAAAAQRRSRPWFLSFESCTHAVGLSALPTLYPAPRSTYHKPGATSDGKAVPLVFPGREDIIFLGGGAFGNVFAARVKVLSSGALLPVAIKTVPEERGLVLTKAHRSAKKVLLAEMQALTLMAECDRIVSSYFLAGDGGIDKSYATQRWLVMELVGGGSLREVSSRRRKTLWPQSKAGEKAVLECCQDVCVAVAAMKAAGVAHNDLKPANISLEMREGKTVARLKVVDFGGVSPAEYTDKDKKTVLQLQACTAGYEAPERIKNALTGKRGREGQPWQWDLFSLGCVCVCIITRSKCITEVLEHAREAMGSGYADTTSSFTDSERWEEWRTCKNSARISQSKQHAFGQALRGLMDEGLPGDAYLSVRDMVWSLLSWDGNLRPSGEQCVGVLTAALD